MRVPSTLSLATVALLVGGLGCSASTMAKPDESIGAARDTSTTTARDTGVQNPPGYRGMERDTTAVPPGAASQPVDTSGALEKDTTGQGQQRETTTPSDSSGRTVPGPDSTKGMGAMDSANGMGGMDSTRKDTSSTGR